MRGLQQHRQQQDSDHLLDFLPYEEEETVESGRKGRTQRSRSSLGPWNVMAFLFTVAISSFAGVHLGSEMARQTVEIVPGWDKRPEKQVSAAPEAAPAPQKREAEMEAPAEEPEAVAVVEEPEEKINPAPMAMPAREESRARGSLEVTAKLLNIRGGPDTGTDLISQANAGEVLQGVRRVKGTNPKYPCWHEVQLPTGKSGFVACEFVRDAGEL